MDPAEAADHVAVGAVQTAYGDAVTRRAWPEVVALFAPDATVTLDLGRGAPRTLGPVELVAFVEGALDRFAFFVFTILNRTVRVDGDEATGRVTLAEVRQDHGGRASTAYGSYDDRYVRTDDGWRIASRTYRSLARTASTGALGDLEVVRPHHPEAPDGDHSA